MSIYNIYDLRNAPKVTKRTVEHSGTAFEVLKEALPKGAPVSIEQGSGNAVARYFGTYRPAMVVRRDNYATLNATTARTEYDRIKDAVKRAIGEHSGMINENDDGVFITVEDIERAAEQVADELMNK